MTLLPIVHRELISASRRPLTHWMRFFAAGGMVLVAWIILASNSTTLRPDKLAEALFVIISGTCFIYALMAGMLHTSDALGHERREGTLGLLFLTDLKGYDVVLGKFVASSVHSVFALVATLPVMAVPILLGGVSVGQFWRMALVLIVTVLLSLSVGMLWSIGSRDTRQAALGTLATILALAGATYFTEWLVRKGTRQSQPWLLSPSPVHAYLRAYDQYRTTAQAPREFRSAVKTQSWMALGGLVAGSILLGRTWRKQLETAADPSVQTVVSWTADDPRLFIGWRHIRWQRWLDANPYYWLARVTRPPDILLRWVMVIGSTFCASLLLLSMAGPQASKNQFGYAALTIGLLLHVGIKIVAALAATRSMNEDRTSGALELMMVAGLKSEEIIRGQRMALHQQFLPSTVILSVLTMLLITRVNLPLNPIGGTFQGVINYSLWVGLLMLWLDLRTIYTVGIQKTLRAPTPLIAMRLAVVRVLFPPWVGAGLIMASSLSTGSTGLATSFGLFWFVGCLVSNGLALARADLDLKEGFNLLAAGLHFDHGEAEVRRDFRRSAEWSLYGH